MAGWLNIVWFLPISSSTSLTGLVSPRPLRFRSLMGLPIACSSPTTPSKKGDKVLVLGASGGVGTACVILAKLLDAEVVACASSEKKLRRLKELGADEVLDYTKVDWSKWAVEKYGKPQRRSYDGGVDVVINFTGGDTWVPSLRCIKRGGKLLVCGATAGYDPKEDLRYVWSFEITIQGSNSFCDEDLRDLMTLIQDGKMKPVIDQVLPLDQAIEGLRFLRDREVIGKVVVEP